MRLPFRSLAVAAIAAATLIPSAPASAAASPTTTTDPAVAAAGWLAQQFVDGTHFNYPPTPGYRPAYWGGLTASGIFALAAARSGATVIDAAADYMAAHVADDADLAGTYGGPYDGSVATAALAAIVAGKDPTNFGGHNLLRQLKDDECPAAATTCTPGAAKGIYSSISESLTILAEARAGAPYAPSAEAASYFLSLQCGDGGFTVKTSKPSPCSSDPDATAYATMALQALGDHATELTAALAWLTTQRNAAGYWVALDPDGNPTGPNVDTTGLAAAALAGAGVDTAASRVWLAAQQVSTGPTAGVGASRGAIKYQGAFDASGSIKATADALLGMVADGSLATLTAAGSTATAPVLALPAATISPTRIAAGGAGTVTLGGFAAGEQVDVVAHSSPVTLGTVTADATGTATSHFTLPTNLAAGLHEITLTGRTSGLSGGVSLTVLGASAPPATQAAAQGGRCETVALACTGLDGRSVRHEVAIGLGLLLFGAAVLMLGRRRARA